MSMRLRAWRTKGQWYWDVVSGRFIVADGGGYNRRVDMVAVLENLFGIRLDVRGWKPGAARDWLWTRKEWYCHVEGRALDMDPSPRLGFCKPEVKSQRGK